MAGKRMLHDISGSGKLATVSYPAAVLWFSMLPLTDVQGNLEANPKLVKSKALPLRDDATAEKVEEWLLELANVRGDDGERGLIAFYEERGKRYLHFIDWEKYQIFNRGRAPRPEFPNHPAEFDGRMPEPQLFEKVPEPTAAQEKPGLIEIPSAPLAFSGRLMKLTAEEHAAIKARFPEFLEPELRVKYGRMDDWCSKKGKRGEKKDWYKFAVNWIAKEDAPGSKSGTVPLPAGTVQEQIEQERARREAL